MTMCSGLTLALWSCIKESLSTNNTSIHLDVQIGTVTSYNQRLGSANEIDARCRRMNKSLTN